MHITSAYTRSYIMCVYYIANYTSIYYNNYLTIIYLTALYVCLCINILFYLQIAIHLYLHLSHHHRNTWVHRRVLYKDRSAPPARVQRAVVCARSCVSSGPSSSALASGCRCVCTAEREREIMKHKNEHTDNEISEFYKMLQLIFRCEKLKE